MFKSTKTLLSHFQTSFRWLKSQVTSNLKIFLLILSTICLFVPSISIAQDANSQRTGDRLTNCINIVMKSPSNSRWDDQTGKSFLYGDNLDILLSWTPAQTNDPKAGAAPHETVQLCAEWNDTTSRKTKANLPLGDHFLKLDQTNNTEQSSQFRIHLDGPFPLGIRRPIEIQVTSSKPELIPSIVRTVFLSHRWLCVLLSSGFVGVIYLFLARGVHLFYAHSEEGETSRAKHHGWRILDPAVISASDYGAASLANLQILWFSLIVTWLLAYGWLVMGRLLTPSTDLLGLLGISGVLNILAKSLSSGKQRLSLDKWNWLIERGFLNREVDIDPVNVAKWGDFVMDGGVLDPSRYQLVVFGFLIGFNLLMGDIMNLETFQIPQFFLLLQTLSSGVYLFGKSVSPNTKDELEQHIAKLMTQSTLSLEDKSCLKNPIASLFGPKAVGPML
jgi:hypothetical protein